MLIERHDGEGAAEFRDAIAAIWHEAFGPIALDDWTESPWNRHRSRDGYRLITARDADRIVGFAWGYTGGAGQHWTDLVARRLGSAADGWLGGHFEFVELAVIPASRGRGIGGLLHDALLDGLPHDRALLSTTTQESAATGLYRSRGWARIGLLSDDTQVLGLRLGRAGR